MLGYLTFVVFAISILSVWVKRDPKIWGGFFGVSILLALISGFVFPIGLGLILAWGLLWMNYSKQTDASRIILFSVIVFLSYGFKLHVFPGFLPMNVVTNFYLGIDSPLIGLFPLALLCPLCHTKKEWKEAFTKGLWLTLAGIAVLAILATVAGTVQPEVRLPTYPATRYLSNLILCTIPEEAFFRGFILSELCKFLGNSKRGNIFALVGSSLLFMLGHVYWAPDAGVMAFVFLAGLLYGGVYLISRRLESAILCHFLLNAVHMTFFTYHAM